MQNNVFEQKHLSPRRELLHLRRAQRRGLREAATMGSRERHTGGETAADQVRDGGQQPR